jgi:hypothetical protein
VLVVPVDITVWVIVLTLIEGVNLTEVITDGSWVVGNDVNHHPNTFWVGSFNQVLEVWFRAEVRVDTIPVLSPVAVVATVEVIDDRRDPNSIKSHSLDVVKAILHAFEGTAAVIAEVGAGRATSWVLLVAISEDLVDRAFFPVGCGTGSGTSTEHSCNEWGFHDVKNI